MKCAAMRLPGLLLLLLSPLLAQNEIITNPNIGQVYTVYFNSEEVNGYHFFDKLIFEITRAPNGDKVFTFQVRGCAFWDDFSFEGPSPSTAKLTVKNSGGCGQLDSASYAITFAVVQAQIGEFLSDDSDAPHRIVYGKPGFREHLTTAPSIAPPDPYMTLLDGFGNTLDKVDLTNNATLSQVVVPSTVGPYGIRPTATGPENEVWVANGGVAVSIADFGSQTVVATIATPSFPPSAVPAGIDLPTMARRHWRRSSTACPMRRAIAVCCWSMTRSTGLLNPRYLSNMVPAPW